MTTDEGYRKLDETFFIALGRVDSATIAECYAPDIRIWNNAQQVELTGVEHIAGLEAFFVRFLNRLYEHRQTDLLAEGFIRQHVLSATFDGEPVRIPMCPICRVTDGHITRIDEYLMLSALPQL